jgi:hypothetical protein
MIYIVIIYTVSTICTVYIVYIVYTVYTVHIAKCVVCYELIIKYIVYCSLLRTCCEICGLPQFISEHHKFVIKCAVYINH